MGQKARKDLSSMKQAHGKEGLVLNQRPVNVSWRRSVQEAGHPLAGNREVAIRVDGPPPSDPHHSEIDQRERLASLGEKIGRIAHDIRNPLGSIELLATLLGKEIRDEKERRTLSGHLVKSVRSLEQLLSNLLVWTKPLMPHLKDVSVRSLAKHIEQAACFSIRDHHATLQWQIAPDAEWMRVDEGLVQQALLNVAQNAMHASPEDSVIELSCHRETGPCGWARSLTGGSFMVFRIEDHGCGISPDDCACVFRPFFSGREGGTGLGLSIVNHIMKVHGGTVTLTSQEGRGTTVELCFPQNRSSVL